MLFRPEDEEAVYGSSKPIGSSIGPKTIGSKLDVPQGAVQDIPAMFKRVNIRLSKPQPAKNGRRALQDGESHIESYKPSNAPVETLKPWDVGKWSQSYSNDLGLGQLWASSWLDVFDSQSVSSQTTADESAPIEETFWKDLVCCNQKIDGLHKLLMHYEYNHYGHSYPDPVQHQVEKL
jgi:hypothetical protein